MTLKILLAVIAFSLANVLDLHAELDGNIWLKTSDDFKVGYSVGIMDVVRAFAPAEKPSSDAPVMFDHLWHINRCAVKKERTRLHVQASIDGYIQNHPE